MMGAGGGKKDSLAAVLAQIADDDSAARRLKEISEAEAAAEKKIALADAEAAMTARTALEGAEKLLEDARAEADMIVSEAREWLESEKNAMHEKFMEKEALLEAREKQARETSAALAELQDDLTLREKKISREEETLLGKVREFERDRAELDARLEKFAELCAQYA